MTCPAGQFINLDFECENCNYQCAACSDTWGTCTECNPTYTLKGPDYCTYCRCTDDEIDTGEGCIAKNLGCDEDQYLLDNICTDCGYMCDSCEENTGVCTACAEGYVFTADGFDCIKN